MLGAPKGPESVQKWLKKLTVHWGTWKGLVGQEHSHTEHLTPFSSTQTIFEFKKMVAAPDLSIPCCVRTSTHDRARARKKNRVKKGGPTLRSPRSQGGPPFFLSAHELASVLRKLENLQDKQKNRYGKINLSKKRTFSHMENRRRVYKYSRRCGVFCKEPRTRSGCLSSLGHTIWSAWSPVV
jgi:hypothetical protein